jgi:two-component system phosphate regulon response regulator PhoB
LEAAVPAVRGRLVLVADDEQDVLQMLTLHLSDSGHRVLCAQDGAEALSVIRRHLPHIVLLDVMMPSLSGFEVCKALKADPRTEQIPVIMLTARTSEVDRVLGFELGVEDYVTKPFSPRELVLRVSAVLRRRNPQPAPAARLQVGAVTIDCERLEVLVQDEAVHLTAIEFRMLQLLMESRGRTISRGLMLDVVWNGEADVEARTVDTHIRRLREKLGSAAAQLKTVRGFGYRMDEV